MSDGENNEIQSALSEGDLLKFDGEFYRKSMMTDQQLLSISEIEQIGEASIFAQNLATLAKHAKTIIDLSLSSQVGLRSQIKEDIKDARLIIKHTDGIAH